MVVALVLAFVASGLFVLSRHGGTVLGDRTLAIASGEVLTPQLEPGDTVVQPVTASDPRLAGVSVSFGTYFGTARCQLEVSLRGAGPSVGTGTGPELASQTLPCADLPDTSPTTVLTFPPIPDSAGESYDVVVKRVDEATSGGVTLWSGSPRNGSLPAQVDGADTGRTASVRLLYDPRPLWVDQLGTIASRMAAYGPSWAGPITYLALVVLLVAAIATAPALRRRSGLLLAVVVIAALARGLLWSATVPAFSGMDEPAHFSNVQFIAEEHALPAPEHGTQPYSDQIETAIDRLNVNATAPGDRADYTTEGEAQTERAIDDASPEGGGGGPAATYSPAYYAPAALIVAAAKGDFFSSVMAARMWSVLLGAAAAALLVLIGRELFPRSSMGQALFAVAGVLQPMAGHQFAIVNNDAWVIAVGFGAFLVSLKLADRARAPFLSLGAGLLIGGALLGKPFGIAVALPLAVGWLVGKVRHRRWTWAGLALEVGLVVVGVVVTYGAWQAYLAHAGISVPSVPPGDGGLRSRRYFLEANFLPGPLVLLWGSQLWGNFGWVRIPFQEPIPDILGAAGVLTVAGVGVWAVSRAVVGVLALRGGRPRVAPATPAPAEPKGLPLDVRLAVTTASLIGIGVALYAAAWMYYAATGHNDLLQGRYALLALPAILAAPALLVERLSPRRGGTVVLLLLAVAMAALTVLGLRNTLETFFG